MLRIHTRFHKRGSSADHQQEGLFATFIDGSNLIQVDDATPGRGLGNGGSPTGNKFGDRPPRQLALKDPSCLTALSVRYEVHSFPAPELRQLFVAQSPAGTT